MYSKISISLIIIGWVSIYICTGCSTRINTRGSRAYHEFTTRYNVYYNAEKTYYEILNHHIETFEDDFTQILPYHPVLYNLSETNSGGPYDVVIDKMRKAIQQHTISAKPRRDPAKPQSPEYRRWLQQNEFNPFIHNAWILMGKAYMQNGEHEKAFSIFNEVIRIFGINSDATYEARLLMTHVFLDLRRHNEAEQLIYLLKSYETPKHLKEMFTNINARYLMQTAQYDEAIPYLQEAIRTEKLFKQKKRLQFLLGQTYTIAGNYKKAHQIFKKLSNLSTPHEFSNNAITYKSALFSNSDSLSYALRSNHILNNYSFKLADDDNIEAEGSIITNRQHSYFMRRRWNSNNSVLYYGRDMHKNTIEENMQFSDKVDTLHRLLLFSENIPQAKEKLLFTTSSFNFTRYKLRTFETAFITLTNGEALSIHPFNSFTETKLYARELINDTLFHKNTIGNTTIIIISEENLNIIQRGVDIERYLSFTSDVLNINIDSQHIFLSTDISPTHEKTLPLKTETAVRPNNLEQKHNSSQYDTLPAPLSSLELLRQLETKEAEAIEKYKVEESSKSNRKILKEREKERKERVKQRGKELKQRQREREAHLRQREKDRQQQIKKRN